MSSTPFISSIQEKILNYKPFDDNEKESLEKFKIFLDSDVGHFSSETFEGHITGTAIITNSNYTRILLVKQISSGEWVQFTAHSNGNPHTDIVTFKWFIGEFMYNGRIAYPYDDNDIFDIDIYTVENDEKRGLVKHFHYDIRFLGKIKDSDIENFHSDKKYKFQWVDIDKLKEFTNDPSLLRCAEKLHKLQSPNT